MATLITNKGKPFIEDIWDIDDFRNVAEGFDEETFTDEELILVMESVVHNFDANIGINWDAIESAFDWILWERKNEK
jgi:hypothetical protein